jgi:hypothetical protein
MLIKPKTKEEIRQAMERGKAGEVFEINAKIARRIRRHKDNAYLKISPLLDENGNVARLGAWEAIDRCIELGRVPLAPKNADENIAKNYSSCWTGALIAYPGKGEKIEKELFYKDPLKNISYILRMPYKFQGIGDDKAIILLFDFFDDGMPYFQRIQSKFKGEPINEIVINNYDALIDSNLLISAYIPRENGYYKINGGTFIPFPICSEPGDPKARFFYQTSSTYIGLIYASYEDKEKIIYAKMPPSKESPVLVL